ncbi:hypothetical protein C8Q73DRAFT_257914 [Cubamyces lactineus]|nr:hypothetical protein C8Q73DRAFT_257914 [Cubamyces lactineus]
MSSGQWSCPNCPLYFDGHSALNLHCAQAHPDLETKYHRFCITCQQIVPKGPVHFATSPKHPKCAGCHVGFEEKAQLREHLRVENACEACMVHHGSADDLESHYLRLTHHRPQTTQDKVPAVDDSPGVVNSRSTEPPCVTPTGPLTPPIRGHLSASSTLLSPSLSSSPTSRNDSKGKGPGLPIPVERTALTRKMLDSLIGETSSSRTTSGSSTAVDKMTHADQCDLDGAASNVSYAGYPNTIPDGLSSIGRRTTLLRSGTDNTAAWSSGYSTTSIVSQNLASSSRRDDEDITQSARYARDLARSPESSVRNTDISSCTRQNSEPLPDTPSDPGCSASSYSRRSAELITPSEERIHAYLRSTGVQQTLFQRSRDTAAQVREWDTSWSCRSCQRVPCIEPVATLCGHVFCRSCILLELGEHGVCPVSRRPHPWRAHLWRLELRRSLAGAASFVRMWSGEVNPLQVKPSLTRAISDQFIDKSCVRPQAPIAQYIPAGSNRTQLVGLLCCGRSHDHSVDSLNAPNCATLVRSRTCSELGLPVYFRE